MTICGSTTRHDRRMHPWVLLSACAIVLAAQQSAVAQKQLADELIVIGAGQRAQQQQRDKASGALAPGAEHNRLGPSPGSGQSALRELRVGDSPRIAQRRDVLSAAANPIPSAAFRQSETLGPPTQVSPTELPPGGPLDRPAVDEEGPADGMTLDAAIVMVAEQNLALRAKFQEIPKATADVLTAGLRGNPLVFGSVDDAPYGQYSPTKPGDVGYGVTIIQPVDINRKRAYRVIAAQRARDVLQAQYQDAVRLEIETLYVRYVDVLAARENLRYVDASLAGLADVRGAIEQLVRGQEVSTLDLDRILVQIDSADVARLDAIAGLEKAKQNLAALLMLPSPEVAPLEIRGSIQSDATALADVDQLLELAQMNRPDLRAYQLGVGRASAEVDLAVKERYPDVFVLYTPWGIKDNTASGGQNTSSWGVSGMASIPIFNRNQGNIRRAELNVGQTRMEWAHLSRQIESEVRQAYRDYQLAAEKVKRLDASILPRAKTIRDKTLTQLRGGQVDTLAYLQSQRDYVEVVRQYRDALVDLRRAALHVNTVVGVRLAY